MKKRKKAAIEERKVYAIGRPSLEKLKKDEHKAFTSVLLSCVVAYYTSKDVK